MNRTALVVIALLVCGVVIADDGDSLDVRYRIRTENLDKWTGVVGLNIGLVNALSFGGEFSYSENSRRITLAINFRL